jgi:hypothetical protein
VTTMTQPLLSEDDALALLKPVLGSFIDGHLRAWNQWEQLQKVCLDAKAAELTLLLDATTRANIVNNYCIAETVTLIEPLAAPNYIEVSNKLGFAAVIVRQPTRSAFVRFKMLDRDKKYRNVSTERQIRLARQEWEADLLTELGFPGTQAPTVLTCGYTLAKDESGIEGIHLVCQQNSTVCWSAPIWGVGRAVIEDLTLDDMPLRAPVVRSTRKPNESEGTISAEDSS